MAYEWQEISDPPSSGRDIMVWGVDKEGWPFWIMGRYQGWYDDTPKELWFIYNRHNGKHLESDLTHWKDVKPPA